MLCYYPHPVKPRPAGLVPAQIVRMLGWGDEERVVVVVGEVLPHLIGHSSKQNVLVVVPKIRAGAGR